MFSESKTIPVRLRVTILLKVKENPSVEQKFLPLQKFILR